MLFWTGHKHLCYRQYYPDDLIDYLDIINSINDDSFSLYLISAIKNRINSNLKVEDKSVIKNKIDTPFLWATPIAKSKQCETQDANDVVGWNWAATAMSTKLTMMMVKPSL